MTQMQYLPQLVYHIRPMNLGSMLERDSTALKRIEESSFGASQVD